MTQGFDFNPTHSHKKTGSKRMHAKLFGLVLLQMAGLVHAGWEMVGKPDGGNKVYIDPARAERKGDIVKVNVMFDYARKQDEGHLSMQLVTEYDCAKKRERDVGVSIHSGNMGAGKVIDSSKDPEPWTPIKVDTLGESIMEQACKVKAAAASRWKLVTKDADAALYLDTESGKRTGNLASFILLAEMNKTTTQNNITFRSMLTETRVDCARMLERVAVVTFYDGPQAQGNKVRETVTKTDFVPIQDSSPASSIVPHLCK